VDNFPTKAEKCIKMCQDGDIFKELLNSFKHKCMILALVDLHGQQECECGVYLFVILILNISSLSVVYEFYVTFEALNRKLKSVI
jgi:hypothetical protein